MPSKPVPCDRKEYFMASKDKEGVCSDGFPKRPVEEYGMRHKGLNMDYELSQPDCQLKNEIFVTSVSEDKYNMGSQLCGSTPGLAIDRPANILAEKSASASHSDSVWLSHNESTRKGREFDRVIDQSSDDAFQHSSNLGHSDNCVSLAHNPIRWIRSGSLSSHESVLSCSSSSKSRSVDFGSSKTEFGKVNMNFSRSVSGDAVSCVTPTTPSEGTSPWKKPRLKWGEGLAKFEKKSLVPEDGPNKSESISCTSAQISECTSPATPSSAPCSSAPGSEVKPFTKAVPISNMSSSSHALVSAIQKLPDNNLFNLVKIDLSIISYAIPSLIEMINSDNWDSESCDSKSGLIMAKLLSLKSEILKAVDMTECQVDLLENELKSISDESVQNDSRCLASGTLAIKFINESARVKQSASEMAHMPALPLHGCTDMVLGNVPVESGNLEVLKADVDSSLKVTTKLIERPFIEPHAVSDLISDGNSIFNFDASHPQQDIQKFAKIASHAGKISSACINGAPDSINNTLMTTCVDESVIGSIWASNREYANKASEDLKIAYPAAKRIEGNSNDGHSIDVSIRELVVRRKKCLRFKEQTVTLKCKAALSIWKDDMRQSSVRNHCSKTQKKWELFSRTTLNNRPSFRSKTLDVIESNMDMGKILSVSHTKPCKSCLKMPALILDHNEKRACIFLSDNGLVEDPCAAEKERSMVNAWTSEERDIFFEKLERHGKDFRKIANFLDHKTTADCVQFYYKKHKSESFTKKVKQQGRRKLVKPISNNRYLVTPSKKWDKVMDTASLDILGAVSELVARNSERKANKKRSSCGLLLHNGNHSRPTQKDVSFPSRLRDFRSSAHEFRTTNNGILPVACGSVSSEAISSCITSSVYKGEGHCNKTTKTFNIISKPPSIPEDILIDDEETSSDESSCEPDVDCWTDIEKSAFVRAVQSHGKDFGMVSRCIRTKSKDQCKSFYSKAHKCLGLDVIHHDNDHEQDLVINDSNGDESESAPVLTSPEEAMSDMGGSKGCQRYHEDLSLSVSVTSNVVDSSHDAGMTSLGCHYKLKDKEGNLEKPCTGLKVEGQVKDMYASIPRLVCVGNEMTTSHNTDEQAFPSKYSVSANKSVDISPSLAYTAPYFISSAQLGTERDSTEPSLLHHNAGENGTSNDNILNEICCSAEDRRTLKATCRETADNLPSVGLTAGVTSQMYDTRGSVRDVTSQNCLSHRMSSGMSNPTLRYISGSPSSEFSSAKNSFVKMQRRFQRPQYAVHQAYFPSNQILVPQTSKKGENNGSAWNLNFEDSTISRGSHSDSENGLTPYASIPRKGYIQKHSSSNSNCVATEFSCFKQSSRLPRSRTINLVGPTEKGKPTNFKLFGQVLTPSMAPETQEPNSTEISRIDTAPVDMRGPNHHNIFLGSENLPVRSFWDGCKMQTVPLVVSCPVPLPHGLASSSVLGRQPLQTTAVPDSSASPAAGSIFYNS